MKRYMNIWGLEACDYVWYIKKLQSTSDFHSLSGASQEDIRFAEKALGLKFADEFRRYASRFAVASFYGHELTGVCNFPRLSVVDVTLSERAANPAVPMDWYVVEQAHIDGIVVWQSSAGEIYQTMPGAAPIKLCESLCAYLEL